MYYSIQHAGGEVYGIYQLPEGVNLTAEQWSNGLREELSDILGINGVDGNAPLYEAGIPIDRVVVDIEPSYGDLESCLERVHISVGLVAFNSFLKKPQS